MSTLEEVQRDLEKQRSDTPERSHRVVAAAVDASVKALSGPAPGRAVLVRSVWQGAQKATVMVQGASGPQVAQARQAGVTAGNNAMRQP